MAICGAATPSQIQLAHPPSEAREHRWTFLSNHAHVLICLARDPHLRLRELADWRRRDLQASSHRALPVGPLARELPGGAGAHVLFPPLGAGFGSATHAGHRGQDAIIVAPRRGYLEKVLPDVIGCEFDDRGVDERVW